MVANYTPGGRGHVMMERLARGPASDSELAQLIQNPNQSMKSARSKAYRVLVQLGADGFVKRTPLPTLTEAGRAHYEAMGPVCAAVSPIASVRVFVTPTEGAPA